MAVDDIDADLHKLALAVEFALAGAVKDLAAEVADLVAAHERLAQSHEDFVKAWDTLVEYIVNNDWREGRRG